MVDSAMACSQCGAQASSLREIDGSVCRLCQRCHEQAQAYSAMDGVLMATAELMDERPDEALLLLRRVHDEHRHHDHDGSLTRRILSHSAFILADHGRYAEALEELDAIPASSFHTPEERADHARERARIVHLLGRSDEAIDELENALKHRHELHPASVLRLLIAYAEVASSGGSLVPVQMEPILREVVQSLGIPEGDDASRLPVADRIRSTWTRFKEGGRRYENVTFLATGKPREEKKRILEEYSRSEPIGFYSELAGRDCARSGGVW